MEPTDTDDDIDIRGDPASLPPTLYVLELAAGVPAATVDWYISRVQGRRRTGGAELLVSAQPQLPGKVRVTPWCLLGWCCTAGLES